MLGAGGLALAVQVVVSRWTTNQPPAAQVVAVAQVDSFAKLRLLTVTWAIGEAEKILAETYGSREALFERSV